MAHTPHPLATLAQIINTPSRQDGIPKQVEEDLRVVGCSMIQEAGIMIDLSMRSFGVTDISISALFLATKLNETPIRLRELINTYIYLSARIQHLLSLPGDFSLSTLSTITSPSGGPSRGGGGSDVVGLGSGSAKGKEKEREPVWNGMRFEVPGFHDEVFWEWKDAITAGEMQILKRLGFNMQVDLPYNHAINYLKILNLVFEDDVAQLVWSILNDMCLTPVYALHPPHTLACASILLATRLRRIALPSGWERLFDANWEDVWSVAGTVMVLWHDWGSSKALPALEDGDDRDREVDGAPNGREQTKDRENRWRRAWVLCGSRKAVRRWLEETGA